MWPTWTSHQRCNHCMRLEECNQRKWKNRFLQSEHSDLNGMLMIPSSSSRTTNLDNNQYDRQCVLEKLNQNRELKRSNGQFKQNEEVFIVLFNKNNKQQARAVRVVMHKLPKVNKEESSHLQKWMKS